MIPNHYLINLLMFCETKQVVFVEVPVTDCCNDSLCVLNSNGIIKHLRFMIVLNPVGSL